MTGDVHIHNVYMRVYTTNVNEAAGRCGYPIPHILMPDELMLPQAGGLGFSN